jgi:hypothetical protein
MCTLVIARRPGHAWPVIIAANRDEMMTRPWLAPGRHWPDRPDVVAGKDELAGGTWLGLNRHGVVAAALNGRRSLGPQTGFRSRGELPLEALDHADAADAAAALAALNPDAYRTCHILIADNRDAFMVSVREDGGRRSVNKTAIPPGVSMITSSGLNDTAHPRQRVYLPQFRLAATPDPETGDWSAWRALLGSRLHDPGTGPAAAEWTPHEGAMTIVTDSGYGTVCSSLIALPAPAARHKPPVFLFCAGRPGEAEFLPVGAQVDDRPARA